MNSELTPEQVAEIKQTRKTRLRYRMTWVFAILSLGLIALLIYEIVTLCI